MEHVALFVVGLVLLAVGGPLLVFGAARLDRATGRGPFAVGIVAVAFGPCVGALAFDLSMVLRQPAVTRPVVGHLVGHTVASVGLVLGVAALVRPVAATAKLFYTAGPLAIVAPILFWFLARNAPEKPLDRIDAGFLLAAFVGALVLLVRAARREPEAVKVEFANWVPERTPVWFAVLLALAGGGAIVGGAFLTASELIGTANRLKFPTFVLGSTMAGFATALPGAVAAGIASYRRRSDLVLGIVTGSVICNVLLVAGAVTLVHPLLVDKWVILEAIPAQALFAALLLPVLLSGLQVPRWHGALLLVSYLAFMAWQVSVAMKLTG